MADDVTDQQQDKQDIKIENIPVTIHMQYIKDLSFENPAAPDTLIGLSENNMDLKVRIDLDAKPIESKDVPNLYEVVLRVNVLAQKEEESVFLVALDYGAVVSVGKDVSEDMHHPLLFIQIPHLMFPFSRQIIASVTAEGGYSSVRLAPINFETLYKERFKEEIAASKAEAEAEKTNA